MTLSDFASIGSFVSGVAVLASLVFLFFQMRQMTEQVRQAEQNQRALMNQGIANRVNQLMIWVAEPHMADLLSRAESGDTQFTRAELRQLLSYLHATLNSARDTYNQHRIGLADQGMLDAALGAIRVIFSQPVYRALWEMSALMPQWRAYVDELVGKAPLAKPVDLVAQFKSNLAELST